MLKAIRHRIRMRGARRRIDRALREADWYGSKSIFTGNVDLSETRYPDDVRLLTVLELADSGTLKPNAAANAKPRSKKGKS